MQNRLNHEGVAERPYTVYARNVLLHRPVRSALKVPVSIYAVVDNSTIIDEAKLYRHRVDPENTPPAESANHIITDRVIYGGFWFFHYGHFLTETLARCWAFTESPQKIVWSTLSAPLITAWQQEICEILQIDTSRFIFAREPVQFSEMDIPTAGIVLRRFVDSRYIHAMGRYPFGIARPKKKVWLSRSKLSKGSRVLNEHTLESKMSASGWTIFHPETHSVVKQLEMMRDASVIAGFDGSAFHTLLLADQVKARVVIVPRGTSSQVPPTYDLIFKAKGVEFKVQPVKMKLVDAGAGRGSALFELDDPTDAFCRILDVSS